MPLLTVQQAVLLLNLNATPVSKATLNRWINNGRLPHHLTPQGRMIPIEAIYNIPDQRAAA